MITLCNTCGKYHESTTFCPNQLKTAATVHHPESPKSVAIAADMPKPVDFKKMHEDIPNINFEGLLNWLLEIEQKVTSEHVYNKEPYELLAAVKKEINVRYESLKTMVNRMTEVMRLIRIRSMEYRAGLEFIAAHKDYTGKDLAELAQSFLNKAGTSEDPTPF